MLSSLTGSAMNNRVNMHILHNSTVKAKFHYASWFDAGRRQVQSQIPLRYLVRSWLQTGSNLSATSFEPDSVMEFGHGPASSC